MKYLVMFSLFITLFFAAGIVHAADKINLARGKVCTFNIKPNYNTKHSHAANLTDGRVPSIHGNQTGWTRLGVVGWAHFWQTANTVQITVDLGRVEPISGVSLTSAGGEGRMTQPSSILIQTSIDGKTFLTAGDLVRLDDHGPIPMYGSSHGFHTFHTDALHTKGRYVRFLCVAPAKQFCCAEVRVYQGQKAWLDQPMTGKAMTEAQALAPLRLTQLGVRRRLLQDGVMVRKAIQQSHVANKSDLLDTLARLEVKARAQVYPTALAGFESRWPVNPLDAKIFALRGRLLAERIGKPGLTLWSSPPYQFLDLLAKPPATSVSEPARQAITLPMMRNEHRARMFNLTNASDHATTANFRLTDLPGGVNPAYVQVFAVQWMDTREGRPRDLLLTPLQASDGWYHTTVAAGFTREIWLSFFPRHLKPGEYHGRIEVTDGAWRDRLGMNLSIAPIQFPNHVDFTLSLWDYIFNPKRSVTDGNATAMKKLFLSHFGNMPWLHWVPRTEVAKYQAQGGLAQSADYTRWDAFVKFWPHARHYGVYLKRLVRGGANLSAAEKQRRVTQFAAAWARHNRMLGLQPGQVVVSFGDEPRTPGELRTQIALAQAFRAGTRDMLIHNNSTLFRHLDKKPYARALWQASDIIMPVRYRIDIGRNRFFGSLLGKMSQAGKQVWGYSCAGGKQRPASYFRLQPWTLFALFGPAGNGEGFWALCDSAVTSNWNDYTAYSRTDYSPIFLAPDRAATGKQMEAIREGVEDWQYLKMLADAGRGKEARKIAKNCYTQVLKHYGNFYGGQSIKGDSNQAAQLAECYRIKALQALVAAANVINN